MYKGYSGKILRINLSNLQTQINATSLDLARRFIGGTGLGGYLLYQEIPQGIDPLGPSNKLLFCTGPATGTIWPTAGRMAVVSKSPLTGIWAESHVKLRFENFHTAFHCASCNKDLRDINFVTFPSFSDCVHRTDETVIENLFSLESFCERGFGQFDG